MGIQNLDNLISCSRLFAIWQTTIVYQNPIARNKKLRHIIKSSKHNTAVNRYTHSHTTAQIMQKSTSYLWQFCRKQPKNVCAFWQERRDGYGYTRHVEVKQNLFFFPQLKHLDIIFFCLVMLAHFFSYFGMRSFIGTTRFVLNYISGYVRYAYSYIIWKRHVLRVSTAFYTYTKNKE